MAPKYHLILPRLHSHGHFRTASCISCSAPFDGNECKRLIVEESQAPKCKSCGGKVKVRQIFLDRLIQAYIYD